MYLIAKSETGNILHIVQQLYFMGMATCSTGLGWLLSLNVWAHREIRSDQLGGQGEWQHSCQDLPPDFNCTVLALNCYFLF